MYMHVYSQSEQLILRGYKDEANVQYSYTCMYHTHYLIEMATTMLNKKAKSTSLWYQA